MIFLKLRFNVPFIICLFLMCIYCSQSNDGIISNNSFSVSGKIINLETSKGMPDIDIRIIEEYGGYVYKGTTDKDGYFKIEKVLKGVYNPMPYMIYRACPKGLVITEMPEAIDVTSGKNVENVMIYLQKGAVISGYVFAADGVNPLKGIELEIEPFPTRISRIAVTDDQGKYSFIGLEAGAKTIHQSSPGFANDSVCIKVKPGKAYENVNFILAKGNVQVKGKVVSARDNRAIKGVSLFFTFTQVSQYYSSGWTETDNNGEYSLIGLKYPGIFELSSVDINEDYQDIEYNIELKSGENILDLKLKPKKNSKKKNKKLY